MVAPDKFLKFVNGEGKTPEHGNLSGGGGSPSFPMSSTSCYQYFFIIKTFIKKIQTQVNERRFLSLRFLRLYSVPVFPFLLLFYLQIQH
jgi:hypothetical protein